jgi:hypothetical protein
MTSEHPLRNPDLADFKPLIEELTLKVKKTQVTKEQLPLSVGGQTQRWTLLLGSVKDFVEKREAELELIPFWRHIAAPFAVVSSLAAILLTTFLGIIKFHQLPPTVPFYYDHATSSWTSIDKSLVIFVPVVLAVVEFILLKAIYEIFRFDERLSVILSWLLTVVNLLVITALGQIYSLIS